jgi:pimeloyl-ACP methyl ester carboxylesterase
MRFANIQIGRRCAAAGLAAILLASSVPGMAQSAGGHWDEAMPSGANYQTAAFRLWLPAGEGRVRGVLVLTPGSNLDGRATVDDPLWQAFAAREHLALIGAQLMDAPPRGFAEQYIDVKRGSGDAFLTAIAHLGQQAGHPELATAPLLLWGMSAGGEFNYEFVAWKPERVAAFVVNKGGVYYSAFLSEAARKTPGLLFTGEIDRPSRKAIISGLFMGNRRAGALWGFVEEKGLGHVEGQSPALARIFFSEVLAQRLTQDGGGLRALSSDTGFIGDPRTGEVRPAKPGEAADETSAWLPSAKVAQAWAEVVKTPGPPAK